MPDEYVMTDFIFGTLGSDDQRIAALNAARSGFTHANNITPRDPKAGQPVRVVVSAGTTQLVSDVVLHFTLDGSAPEPGGAGTQTLPLHPTSTEWNTLLWGYICFFAGEVPGQPNGTTVRYKISGLDASGARIWADNGVPSSYAVDDHRVPAWVSDAVIYHIFMDRFAPAPGTAFATHDDVTGFYDGTLSGVLNQLDYLSDLGVNCLWLSPIFPSPSHHRYDATDFRDVDARLGTRADLKALVDEAHRRGIRIILDFVPNHTSNEHPFFVSATTDPASPYRDFYTFTQWPDQYETFFGVKQLPQINNNNKAARKYVIDSALFWMQEYGVDGYRLDYADGPSHDFWTDYYTAVKAANPDSFHFGEIVETPALMRSYEGIMDGTLDFLWLQSVRKLIAYGSMGVGEFEQFLSGHEAYFGGANFALATFVDNHDMNRFLWITMGDTQRLQLAAVCQFTLASTPIIYYGTEVGLSQLRDIRQGTRGILEESRLPMLWGDSQNKSLHAFYKQLIQLRHSSAALRRGKRVPYLVDPTTGRYGYSRQLGAETVLVLLNIAPIAQQFVLPAGAWRDAFTNTHVSGSVTLEPFGFLVVQ